MSDTGWDAERIAELRRLAEGLGREMRPGGWSGPLDDAISDEERAKATVVSFLAGGTLLSLLDELERSNRERDALVNAHRRRVREIKALQGELERVTRERDDARLTPAELREAFRATQ